MRGSVKRQTRLNLDPILSIQSQDNDLEVGMEEVPLEGTISDLNDIAGLAGRDQRLSEARNAAAMYANFWNELPDDMPEQLRVSLLLSWQQSHSQWVSFMAEEEEYE